MVFSRCLLALVGTVGILTWALGPASAGESYSSAKLRATMGQIAQATHGPVGAAVRLVEGGGVIALHGEQHFPMQSVYKLPIGMAVLHQVDQGALRLDQSIQITPHDLTPPSRYSPIAQKYPYGTTITVSALLEAMITVSDGTASDVLLKLVGGPQAVTRYLHGLGVRNIVVATSEAAMAQNDFVQYKNWATPDAIVELLRLLQRGQGLTGPSRQRLLALMSVRKRGKQLSGLLPAGTVVTHKSGGSGTVDGLTRATNDAGLITLPDGRHLAIAVFVSDTRADAKTRDFVIAQIARAAWELFSTPKSPKTGHHEP